LTEDELLGLSFAQLGRAFEAYRVKEEISWMKFRHIAYETWRKGAKNAPGIDTYMPIGEVKKLGDEDLKQMQEDWDKHKKLNKKVKRKKLLRRLKNVNRTT